MNDIFTKKSLAIGVALAIGISGSSFAQLASENPGINGVNSAPTLFGGDIVLFDQTDSPNGNGVPDQDFEAVYDTYDAMGADDFVVTDASGWTVNAMNTIGTTGTPGNATVTITFYPDAGGTPDVANPVCSFPGLVPADNAGSFDLTFPASCILSSDSTTVYWVSQFTDQNFGANGQHFWSGRSAINGNESQWVNAGGGFGTPCATFMSAGTVCGVGGGVAQDRLFSLEGVIGGGSSADLSVVKTLNTSAPFRVGDNIEYTIAVTNNGTDTANNVVIDDSPLNLTIIAVSSAPSGECTSLMPTCTISSIVSGSTETITVIANIDNIGPFDNGVSTSADELDPDTSNNADPAGGDNGGIAVDALPSPAEVPTMSFLGSVIFILSLLAAGILVVRGRAR